MKYLLMLTLFVMFYIIMAKELPERSSVLDFMRRLGIPAISALLFFSAGTAVFLSPLAGIFMGLLGWKATRYIFDYMQGHKLKEIRKQSMDFITSSTSLYMAGQNTVDVVAVASRRMPEPLATELKDMLASRSMREGASFSKMFNELSVKYGIDEFKAVSQIIAAGQISGGPKIIAKGLSRLRDALIRRSRLMTERAKSVTEPAFVAWVVIALLTIGAIVDATILRDLFASSLSGRIDLGLGVGVAVGLFILVMRLMKNKDL